MECKQCEGKGKLPLFSTRFGFTNDRYYPCPTCGGTGEENQMENKRRIGHHMVDLGDNTELKNIVEVKIESVDIEEPDPIKVGDEVECHTLLTGNSREGIVEGVRDNFGACSKEYKINNIWLSDVTYSIHKKVDEEDIVWGTVEEVISGGMNSVNEKHTPSVFRTPEEIIEGVKKFIEEGNRTVVSPPLSNIKIDRVGQDNSRKHQTTMEEDFLNVLLED